MLSARARAVRDRRHAPEGAEAVAVVDERLGAGGQLGARGRSIAALKRRDQSIGRIERERIADQEPVAGDARSRVGGEPVETGLKFPLDGLCVGPRQPAPGSLKPGLLGVLVIDLARVNLADEDAGRAADRMRRIARARPRAGRAARPARRRRRSRSAPALDRMTSWTGGPCAADHHFPGRAAAAGDRQHVAKRLREQDGIAHEAVADELVELAAVAPGGLVQVVRGQEDRTGGKSAGIAECPDRFDRGGHAPFHVRGSAAGEQPVVLDSRRHERQVNRVEVAVELERRPRPAAFESDHDGGSLGVSARRTLDLKPIGREDFRQAIADRPRFAGPAGHFDQAPSGLDQPLAIHMGFQAFDGCWINIHKDRL